MTECVCPMCGGTGIKVITSSYGMSSGQCPLCKGRGKIAGLGKSAMVSQVEAPKESKKGKSGKRGRKGGLPSKDRKDGKEREKPAKVVEIPGYA